MPASESDWELLNTAYTKMTEALSVIDICEEHFVAAHLSTAIDALAQRLIEKTGTPIN